MSSSDDSFTHNVFIHWQFINDVKALAKSKSVKKNSKRKVWKPTGKVFTNIGYIWRPTGRTFTIIENECLLTRITTTTEVPLRKPTALKSDTPKPVVTLVYLRKPKKSKINVPVSKSKITKFANNKEPSKSWGSIVSDVPSFSLDECMLSKLSRMLRSQGFTTWKDLDTTYSPLGNSMIRTLRKPSVYTVSWSYDGVLSYSHLVKGLLKGLSLAYALTSFSFELGELTNLLASMVLFRGKVLEGQKMELQIFYQSSVWIDPLRLQVPVRRIRTDNGTEFVNQTLREYYEKVGISHETSIARSPHQNGCRE
ncbi:integrase, catalytic region, zinc finger, CCHC-type containing protein [Tanacetum coccineum]